jgi:hypothetical protein
MSSAINYLRTYWDSLNYIQRRKWLHPVLTHTTESNDWVVLHKFLCEFIQDRFTINGSEVELFMEDIHLEDFTGIPFPSSVYHDVIYKVYADLRDLGITCRTSQDDVKSGIETMRTEELTNTDFVFYTDAEVGRIHQGLGDINTVQLVARFEPETELKVAEYIKTSPHLRKCDTAPSQFQIAI